MNGQQLKNSILQMAVQGKLVPQDPNDEPASVLLERIHKEKEQLIKDGKIKKEKNSSYIFRGADNLPYEKIGNNDPVCIADKVPFEIPNSWEWTRINEISIPIGNKHNQILSKDILPEGMIPVVSQSQNLIDGYCNNIEKKIDILPLVMFGDHTRNVKFIDFDFVIGADGTKFHKILLCNSKYIYYWMFFTAETLKNRGYARHYTLLKECFIPIPPFAEQQRIIEKVEELLPHIEDYEEYEAKFTKLQTDFPEQLKKSILQQAVMGKLVPQDPNDEPASVLLERIRAEKQKLIEDGKIKKDKHESIISKRDNSYYEKLNGIERCIDDEIPFEIPDNWCWVRLGTVIGIQRGASPRPKGSPEYWSSTRTPYHWIKISDISKFSKNGALYDTNEFLTEFGTTKSVFVDEDYLITAASGSLGKIAKLGITGYIYDGLMCMCFKNTSLNMNYIVMLIQTMVEYLMAISTGTAWKNITTDILKNLLVPLPPLAEQQRIDLRYEKLLRQIKRL